MDNFAKLQREVMECRRQWSALLTGFVDFHKMSLTPEQMQDLINIAMLIENGEHMTGGESGTVLGWELSNGKLPN